MKFKIYYHHTDCGGVVYYANYLKFFEEARTTFFEEKGLSVKELAGKGILFVVARQEIDYKSPAFYADTLEVTTALINTSAVRLEFSNEIKNRDKKLICTGKTILVCIGSDFKPKAMSEDFKRLLNG